MRVDWTTLKTRASDKSIERLIQYTETNSKYKISLFDGVYQITTKIRKTSPAGTDQSDFETNFKDDANFIIDTPKEFATEASKLKVLEHETINKFGSNRELGAVKEVVWNSGGILIYPTSAAVVSLVSTSADDDLTGTGARTINIIGLDANYAQQEESVNLDGTTSVSTSNTFIRVFRLIVTTAGSGESNAGEISATISGGNVGKIPLGKNQSLMALYTVPAGHRAFLKNYYMAIPKDKEIEGALEVRPFGEVFQIKHEIFLNTNHISHDFGYPLRIEEKSDIQMTAKSLSGVTHSVTAGFDLVLVKT